MLKCLQTHNPKTVFVDPSHPVDPSLRRRMSSMTGRNRCSILSDCGAAEGLKNERKALLHKNLRITTINVDPQDATYRRTTRKF